MRDHRPTIMRGRVMRRVAIATVIAASVAGATMSPGDAIAGARGSREPQTTAPSRGAPTATIAAVGDMVCDGPPSDAAQPTSSERRYQRGFCQYAKVSDLLLQGTYDAFLPIGDLQYYSGFLSLYEKWYAPSYGRVMDITMPAPGNHDSYAIDSQGRLFAGYRRYFGRRAHWNRWGGAYSFDLGGWHIISLNSEVCPAYVWYKRPSGPWVREPNPWGAPCKPGGAEYRWLVHDLRANADTACTLAYFHRPAFFWGVGFPDGTLRHPGYSSTRPFYRALYRYGADVILTGHMHYYQRMVPLAPDGKADPRYGFTQFIVGTGGDSLEQMPPAAEQPDTVAAASNTAFGILRLQLRDGGYDFDFVPAVGSPGHWRLWHGMKVFENGGGQLPVDEGSGTCHGAPPRRS